MGQKTIKVTALRDFSNTIFGNISTGQSLEITPDRFRVWKAEGLVKEAETAKAKKIILANMDKDELEAFAKDQFGIDIDKRRGVVKLRADVKALMDTMGNGNG